MVALSRRALSMGVGDGLLLEASVTDMRQYRLRFAVALACALSVGLAASSCQKVDKPKTTLTQKQWEEVKSHILDDEPDVDYPVGANFDDKFELIGFDVSSNLSAGKEATFTWYWKALEETDDNWKIFVHFDSSEKTHRQNLDHHPLEGLYRTGRWKEGQIIEDIQKVTIDSDYPEGQAIPYIGFFRGDERLPIKNEVKKTDDSRVIGPTLDIEAPSQKEDDSKSDEPPHLTATAADSEEKADIDIDGKLDDKAWEEADPIALEPLGSAKKRDARVRLVYDDDRLYVGARLEDDHIWSEKEERDARTWEEEVFEVFIDPEGRNGEDYVELQINPLGTIFDAHFEQQLGRGEGSRNDQIEKASSWDMEGLESKVHVEGTVNDDSDRDEYWSVELAIPFEQLPGTDGAPDKDEEWAVNFYRYDRPDDKTTYTYAWSAPSTNTFHQVERFGRVAFGSSDQEARADSDRPKDFKKIRRRFENKNVKLPKNSIDKDRIVPTPRKE